MYLLIPDQDQYRRVAVPAAIEAQGDDAIKAFRAKPPADAWDAAEIVGPSWPHPEPVAAVADVPDVPEVPAVVPVLVVSPAKGAPKS